MLQQELALQRIGMVEVALSPLFEGEMREVAVVVVEGKKRRLQLECKLACKRRFTGAGAAGDANHQRPNNSIQAKLLHR